MHQEFWHKKWETNDIGFHKPAAHQQLKNHFPKLNLAKGSSVLVPLCGKSQDLLWLEEQGYQVVGVEISKIAIESFFAENQRSFVQEGDCYRSKGLEIWCQDFFMLQKQRIHSCQAVYDRAALVALPAPMRNQYVQKITQEAQQNCQYLLVSFSYSQDKVEGPPFSVDRAMVEALYGEYFNIKHLDQTILEDLTPRMKAAGLKSFSEDVYHLTKQ